MVFEKFTILLIDDEPSVLRALQLLLEAIGYHSIPFSNSSEARAFLPQAASQCDLILCDLKMPEFDGMEVLESRNTACPELPFVLMSAHATSLDVDKAIAHGANGFLSKPFSPDELKSVIESLEITQRAVSS
ncbi:MAG: response regulator [Bdellovibrionales bacterium]|nr:response regulator [Bdellovibrionales bacterium]